MCDFFVLENSKVLNFVFRFNFLLHYSDVLSFFKDYFKRTLYWNWDAYRPNIFFGTAAYKTLNSTVVLNIIICS